MGDLHLNPCRLGGIGFSHPFADFPAGLQLRYFELLQCLDADVVLVRGRVILAFV